MKLSACPTSVQQAFDSVGGYLGDDVLYFDRHGVLLDCEEIHDAEYIVAGNYYGSFAFVITDGRISLIENDL